MTTNSVIAALIGVGTRPKPDETAIAATIAGKIGKIARHRRDFRSCRAAVIFTACGAAIRVPCRDATAGA
jgi:hypothetical protein